MGEIAKWFSAKRAVDVVRPAAGEYIVGKARRAACRALVLQIESANGPAAGGGKQM